MKKLFEGKKHVWTFMSVVIAAASICAVSAAGQSGKQVITIQTNTDGNPQLFRDGVAWIPHGVQMVAFVETPGIQKLATSANNPKQQKWFYTAYTQFSNSEFDDIKAWGADTVRMQVSEPGTDSTNEAYDAAFVDNYVSAVKYARSIGLNVIVSVQDENQYYTDGNGAIKEDPMSPNPSSSTMSAWKTLTSKLNGDLGIMYELYNEPGGNTGYRVPSPAWTNYSDAADTLVGQIRNSNINGTPVNNVIISDGLNQGQSFINFIPLKDNNVLYSVHPYFHQSAAPDASTWTPQWGYLTGAISGASAPSTGKVPVIVGEWGTLDQGDYLCSTGTPQAALNMLNYMRDAKIGLIAVTWDESRNGWGGLDTDTTGNDKVYGISTTLTGACNDDKFGAGKTIRYWYNQKELPGQPL